MIINTGMRTDIPAFYSTWLLNRIRDGYVMVRNPFFEHKVTRYSLSPDVVDVLAFCTKNPHPLIGHLKELDKYKQFWFITITPYGEDIERNVPDKRMVINDFKILSKHLGKSCVALRYDPIIITKKYTIDYHIKCFDKLLYELSDYTNDCTISFIDIYDKVKRNAPYLRKVTKEEQIVIAREFKKIGDKYNIVIHACCEKDYLGECGLDMSGCMSREIVETAIGRRLVALGNNSKRAECNCLMGNDIGAYNTCLHGCVYCYANTSMEDVINNYKRHNPNSPLLIGELGDSDEVHDALQSSWISDYEQITLF